MGGKKKKEKGWEETQPVITAGLCVPQTKRARRGSSPYVLGLNNGQTTGTWEKAPPLPYPMVIITLLLGVVFCSQPQTAHPP